MGGLLGSLFDGFLFLMQNILNTITIPFVKFLELFLPNDMSYYFNYLGTFIIDYFLKGFQFAKMCFINFFNINHTIFDLFTVNFGLLLGLYGFLLLLKKVYNIYMIVRGSKDIN